ncbi:MAG: flagellar biosynthetic protein FliO [Planctomycetota bacterium]
MAASRVIPLVCGLRSMGQKIIPALLKVLPREAGPRRFLFVLLAAIALGILAGTLSKSRLPTESSSSVAPADAIEGTTPRSSELAGGAKQGLSSTSFAEMPSLAGIWITLVLFMLLGLGVILLLGRHRRFRPGNGSLHVVDTIPLGARRLVHLIRCGDRKYLIANSEKGINYLATLPSDPLEREVEQEPRKAEGELTFDELLSAGGPR